MTLIRGGIDTEVKEVKIPKYKATKSTTDRVTLFKADEWKIIAKRHYIPGIGTVHCWDSLCCKRYGEPKISNVYPVIKYPSTKDGDLITQGEPELLRLELSNKKDKSVKTKNKIAKDQGKDISKMDMLIVGSDEIQKIDNDGGRQSTDYIDFIFEGPLEGKPGYVRNPVWANIIKDQWEFYKENIEKTLARVINDDIEFLEILKTVKETSNGNQQSFQYSNKGINTTKALPDNSEKIGSTTVDENADINDLFEDEPKKESFKPNPVKAEPARTTVITQEKSEQEDIDKLFED
ncbi:MAG: hypothetical protein ABSG25_05730 [Bryobacteraceae bacterium]